MQGFPMWPFRFVQLVKQPPNSGWYVCVVLCGWWSQQNKTTKKQNTHTTRVDLLANENAIMSQRKMRKGPSCLDFSGSSTAETTQETNLRFVQHRTAAANGEVCGQSETNCSARKRRKPLCTFAVV